MPRVGWPARLARDALDFLYPPHCLWCSGAISTPIPGLCRECQDHLAPRWPHRCLRCSAPVGPHLDTNEGCLHCRDDAFHFRAAVSLGPYSGELKEACRVCKQTGHATLTRSLSDLLTEREGMRIASWNIDVVLPVPHFWLDRLFQSHHPSDTLAEHLAEFLKVPVERHILVKAKRTPRQSRLSPSARRRNLRSAFRLAGRARLKGLHLLLADDVLTTGTTARRAAQELLRGGAASVHVAVLSRATGA